MVMAELDSHVQKKISLNPYITPYTKINLDGI